MSETETTMMETYSGTERPGHRLAAERKSRGLSLEEVAAQLRLNVSTLQALENDDYSHLPPAAYVSGYLRSYARALGLSEAEIGQGGTSGAAEPALVGVHRTSQVQASDPRVRAVSYVVIGGLLLLSSAWWLVQREEMPAEPVAEETVSAPAPEGVTVDPAEVAAADAPLTPVVPEAPGAGLPGSTLPATSAAAPAPATASVPPAPAPERMVETPPKPVAPPPPLTAAMPQSKVVLEFTADCWVDVTDAAGRQLAYDLAPAGRRLTLRGEAPFKVFFGYSPGVQVRFNDELFDHRPFQRRDMARFKLGTADDNALLTEAQ